MSIVTFNITTLEDIQSLKESYNVECKLASGRTGEGELPEDFWLTYSAFANTHGGIVILGVREIADKFKLEGILRPEKLIKDLFNQLNNRQKVSINLLKENDVIESVIDQKKIIIIAVPRASRKQRPIFLKGNPLGNTYKRFGEGDRLCDEETVKRFLAEQIEQDRDNRILSGFTFDNDINLETFQAYRIMFRDTKPSHPFLADSDFEFFKKIRGWRKDRETGQEGMTLAGLLMFGKLEAIQDAVPNYFLDYQENTDFSQENRWSYRFITDSTWSGNLFDFYQKVYRRLIDDLDIPFILKGAQRLDESTSAHAALREALINTLVHADYTGRLSVLIVKKANTFIFRNPGCMRVPIEQAQHGGESDCRNGILHDMFLKVGLGEKAGSGVPKIYSGWKSCNWLPPKLSEKDDPESTCLELRMADLVHLPYDKLEVLYGDKFNLLDQQDRMIVAFALDEKVVSHTRLAEVLPELHARDLSDRLKKLTSKGFLETHGKTRGTVYQVPGTKHLTPDDVFPANVFASSSEHLVPSSEHIVPGQELLAANSEHLGLSSEHLELSSEHLDNRARDDLGRLLIEGLDAPIIEAISNLDNEFRQTLLEMAENVRESGRVSRVVMISILLQLCTGHYIALPALAELLDRSPDALRQQYLKGLISEHKLGLAFPGTPTHPQQAYKTL